MGGGLEKHRGSLKSSVTWRRNEWWGEERVGTWQEKDLLVEVKESSQGEGKEKKRLQQANRAATSDRPNPPADGAR